MASSNRHWPSMFKSKHCNNQWQQDINQSLISSACQRPTYSSVSGCGERSSEPKPRWNPKPEQIRILEAIFNSGMVNPPRDEIRKIRSQLLEYGQIGDANVFYWFQNRKSRTKYKLRHLHNSKQNHNSQQQQQDPPSNIFVGPTCSSSPSSSDSINKPFSNSPTASVNQTTFFQNNMTTTTNEFLNEPFLFPLHHSTSTPTNKENSNFCSEALAFCFSTHDHLSNNVPQQNQQDPCTGLILSEIMDHHGSSKRDHQGNYKVMTRMEPHQLNFSVISTPPTAMPRTTPTSIALSASTINRIQGVGEQEAAGPDGAVKSTVFINDVPFEVASGPFNVRDAFGDEAVLIHSSGHPILTNYWGVTLQSLQHGAFYYLANSVKCREYNDKLTYFEAN